MASAITLNFAGIVGDCHSGLTRKSDSRTLRLYRRDTDIRNVRQLSLLSVEELAEVAAAMDIPEVKPEWVGANLVTSGIPDLTLASAFDAIAISIRRDARRRSRKCAVPLRRRCHRQASSRGRRPLDQGGDA